MGCMTLREYANNNGISYEAVRKLVIRHKKALGEHLTRENGTQYLDDVAQEILDSHRARTPLVVMEKRLDSEYRELTERIMQKDNQIQALQNELLKLQNETIKLTEYKTRLELLEESKNELKDQNNQLKNENKSLSDELENTKTELNAFIPSILGFYRKR